MKKVKTCRCCKSDSLYAYLDLGLQPLANNYHKKTKLAKYPLVVMVCKNCFHNMLSIIVSPDSMYTNYLYVSGTTKTFRRHTEKLAQDAIKRINKKHISVLDIACNDGTQLEYFRDLGCDVVGVDPAKNLRKITEGKNIPVIVAYWSQKIAKSLNKKFDIITGTNVFAHVNDLDEFLLGVKIALTDDGILILEFPYADMMIEHNEFDTVYHEHLSYFLVHSFKTLIERLGMCIIDIMQTPVHGGSIRLFVRKGKGIHTDKVDDLIKSEKSKGLLDIKTYKAYTKRVKRNKREMKQLLRSLQNSKKIIGYGASAKGNTMLNYFKINLNYIVDDNPLKWGYLTPGRNIPIVSPEEMRKEKQPLAIVILSWNFYYEIIKKILEIRRDSSGDRAILYVPHVKSFPIKKDNSFKISA